MAGMTTPRPHEAAAFLQALDSTPPTTLSACVSWTAHEVTAHLAAGAAEVSGVLGPLLLSRGADRDPGRGRDVAARLRSDGQPDVRIWVEAESYRIGLAHDQGSAAEP